MLDLSWNTIYRFTMDRAAKDPKYRKKLMKSGKPLPAAVAGLSDLEILKKLESLGWNLKKEELKELIKKFPSAEEITKHKIDNTPLIVKGYDEDWIWLCVMTLWERWFPERTSFEKLDNMMQEGYDCLENDRIAEAMDIWLELWKNILKAMKQLNISTINDFDSRFNGTQSVSNWTADMEMELWNAGRGNSKYYFERIKFCEYFLKNFYGQDQLENENMKRAIGETYAELGRTRKAERLFRRWLTEGPKWGWGWIGWSDCYWLSKKNTNYEKAELILTEGLAVDEVDDREDMLERLMQLYYETGDNDKADKIKDELRLCEFEETAEEERETIREKKIGRNEPCPCDSGKKYKKCCGK